MASNIVLFMNLVLILLIFLIEGGTLVIPPLSLAIVCEDLYYSVHILLILLEGYSGT